MWAVPIKALPIPLFSITILILEPMHHRNTRQGSHLNETSVNPISAVAADIFPHCISVIL